MEDCPWLLIFYSIDYTLHYDWVANVSVNIYAHGNRKYLTLDEALRQRRLGDGLRQEVK